ATRSMMRVFEKGATLPLTSLRRANRLNTRRTFILSVIAALPLLGLFCWVNSQLPVPTWLIDPGKRKIWPWNPRTGDSRTRDSRPTSFAGAGATTVEQVSQGGKYLGKHLSIL